MTASALPIRRERLQGAGLDAALPYLLLAPAVLIVLAVLIYPLYDGLRASTAFYRYGRPLRDVGLGNYLKLWSDPEFLNSLWVTVSFVTLSVAIETVLGLLLTNGVAPSRCGSISWRSCEMNWLRSRPSMPS